MNGYVSSKAHIALNDECTLIAEAAVVNDLGIQVNTTAIETPVYCGRLSVEGKEYHEAGQQGLKPGIVLAVHTEEYDGQDYVDFEGRRYTIYRRYERTDGITELHCTLKVGDRGDG